MAILRHLGEGLRYEQPVQQQEQATSPLRLRRWTCCGMLQKPLDNLVASLDTDAQRYQQSPNEATVP